MDITVHQVAHNGGLVELHKASGGAWGGTKVDEAYEKFLEEITGSKYVQSTEVRTYFLRRKYLFSFTGSTSMKSPEVDFQSPEVDV